MVEYNVVGFSYEEIEEIEKELNCSILTDVGIVGFDDGIKTHEELKEEVINKINEKYNKSIPLNAYAFSQDGDQYFKFYIGFMY